uniref:Immunoglobulin domain-containing protein n=1 Tax=Pygocentrus nattereri TaxID=42514 RepID=A0AAR2LT81_PYGNA
MSLAGAAAGIDVIGFLGGRVTINCKHSDYEWSETSFCKMKTQAECDYIIVAEYEQHNTWIQKDRFELFDDSYKTIIVSIRQLSSEDAGTYQCGQAGSWSHQINLRVIRDPCYLGSNTVAGYVGETVTISCSYPEEFESHNKYFYKLDAHHIPTMMDTTETQRGRFSISDDRRSKVVSVRISDVREADGGVYYCGLWREGESVSYQSFYTEIQLQVTAKSGSTTHTNPSGSSNTITVCACVALLLLLIGGLALIFLRCIQAKGSSSNSSEEGINSEMSPAACVYEEIQDFRPQSDSEDTPLYAIIQPPIHPSDPLNSVYTTAQLPKMPSHPPETVYVNAQLPTIPSDHPNEVYATVQLPTIPSDPPNEVYATAQLPTTSSHPPKTYM